MPNQGNASRIAPQQGNHIGNRDMGAGGANRGAFGGASQGGARTQMNSNRGAMSRGGGEMRVVVVAAAANVGNTERRQKSMRHLKTIGLIAAGVLLLPFGGRAATPDGKGFPSADAAAKALVNAAKSDDVAALKDILGPSAKNILETGDPVADRKERRAFARNGPHRR